MSLQRRLVVLVSSVLVASLMVAAALTYVHVTAKVTTELKAALSVGAHTVSNAFSDGGDPADPATTLRLIIRDFDGDRHIQAVLRGPTGDILARSTLLPPGDPAPDWFYRLAVSAPLAESILSPGTFQPAGELTLIADPHNEVSEAWSDVCLTMAIMAVFFSMVLGMSFLVIRSAIAPLRSFSGALAKIGSGDYSTRFVAGVYQELRPVRDAFNEMAARLETIEAQNHRLNEQLLNVQDDERAELARDLHDDVAPFLFAVGADAAMIRQFAGLDKVADVQTRAGSIEDAVRHMQKHVRNILGRLAPGALLNLGLPSAIENLAGFWTARCPDVTFHLDLAGDVIDPPLDAVIFRVVQESFSNAIRHGNPKTLSVRIAKTAAGISVMVEDDGTGFPASAAPGGFGIRGMSERVKAAGGTFQVRNRPLGKGVIVEASFELSAAVTSRDSIKPDVFA